MPVFISLGENCLVDAVLGKLGLKEESFPFGSSGSNIEYISQIIESDFKDFLNPDCLKKTIVFQLEVVINIAYSNENQIFYQRTPEGFEFAHHNVLEQKDRDSMERKVNRFRQVMQSGEKIVFIYNYRHHKNQDVGRMLKLLEEFLHMLRVKYSRKFKCILFFQTISQNERNFIVKKYNSGLLSAEFVTAHVWGGNDNWDGRSDDDQFRKLFSNRTVNRFCYSNPLRNWSLKSIFSSTHKGR
jgi:hypothetical protein